jgi:hypothetical protein
MDNFRQVGVHPAWLIAGYDAYDKAKSSELRMLFMTWHSNTHTVPVI